ncbi:MAG: TSUP family transporter [Aeoliella sp.]
MILFDIPLWHLIVALVVTFLGALVQGSVGFGLAVIAAPVLLVVNPEFVPGSMLIAALVLCGLLAVREKHSIIRKEVVVSSVSRLVTTVPTALLISHVDTQTFSIVFALVVIVAVGISFSGYHLPLTMTNLTIASAVSGITNTISAIGGPPMAMVYQDQRGDHIRATLSVIFAIGTLFSITCLAWVDEFHWRDVALGLALLPGILAGFALSRYTTPWLDKRGTRPAVLGIAALSAVVILVRAIEI